MGNTLELVTSGGDLWVSGPILFSIFVSMSLQVQAWVYLNSETEIIFGRVMFYAVN